MLALRKHEQMVHAVYEITWIFPSSCWSISLDIRILIRYYSNNLLWMFLL
jgi:hypothetical protein